MLAKPQTFMNSSGESVSKLSQGSSSILVISFVLSQWLIWYAFNIWLQVGAIVSYYKIPLKQVLVVNILFPM